MKIYAKIECIICGFVKKQLVGDELADLTQWMCPVKHVTQHYKIRNITVQSQ